VGLKVTLRGLVKRVSRLGRAKMQRVLSWATVRELAILLSFGTESEVKAITSNMNHVGRESLYAEMRVIKRLRISDEVYAEIGRKIARYVDLALEGESYKTGQVKSFVRPVDRKGR
jgi:hypothetical protein